MFILYRTSVVQPRFFVRTKSLETQHPFMSTLTGLSLNRCIFTKGIPRMTQIRWACRIAMLETGLPPWKKTSWLRSERWWRNERQRPSWLEGDGFRFVRMQIYLLVCFFLVGFWFLKMVMGVLQRCMWQCMYVILVHDLDNLIVWKYGSTRLLMTSESITLLHSVFKWNSTLPRIVLSSFRVNKFADSKDLNVVHKPLGRRWREWRPVPSQELRRPSVGNDGGSWCVKFEARQFWNSPWAFVVKWTCR